MPAIHSNMVELGFQAPDFSLIEPSTSKTIALSQFVDTPILIGFVCNHCPFVIHIRDVFNQCAKQYQNNGVAVVLINSNDATTYPADSPENMITEVTTYSLQYHYLFDETQQIARAYNATCTPDFFLFDAKHQLYYRGQFDDSRPTNTIAVTGDSLNAAVDDLLQGKQPPTEQKPSIGCSIKWR